LGAIIQEQPLADLPRAGVTRYILDGHFLIARIDRRDLGLERFLVGLDFPGGGIADLALVGAEARIQEEYAQRHDAQADVEDGPPARYGRIQFRDVAIPYVNGIVVHFGNALAQPCALGEQQPQTEGYPAKGDDGNEIAPEAIYKITHESPL